MANTEKRIVGFIDILGFKDMVNRFDSGKEPELLNDIIEVLKSAGGLLRNEFPLPVSPLINVWKKLLEVKVFSDCFCISIPFEHPDFSFAENVKLYYQYISGFQILLLEKGYLVRGGITIGSYYSDENIIFSGGLVDAYELESKVAKMPRITISETLLTEINKNKLYNSDYMFLCEGNISFLNPFNHRLFESDLIDKFIEEEFKKKGMVGIMDKTFREIDEEDKKDTLNMVLKSIEEKLSSNVMEQVVRNKYDWLIEFIKFESGLVSKLNFEKIKN